MWKSHFMAALALAGLLAGALAAPAGAAAATYGELMSALKNAPAEAATFRGMMGNLTSGQFQFTDVQTLLGGDRSAFEREVRKDASHIASLRETLAHTTLIGSDGIVTLLSTLMKQQGLSIDRVVAVHVSGAQITLFYQ